MQHHTRDVRQLSQYQTMGQEEAPWLISFIIVEAVQVRIAGEKQGREPQLDILAGVDAVHWYINTEIRGFSANTSAKVKQASSGSQQPGRISLV